MSDAPRGWFSITQIRVLAGLALLCVVTAAAIGVVRIGDGADEAAAGPEPTVAPVRVTNTATTPPPPPTTTTQPPYEGWVDPASAFQPWGNAVEGLLTFRGNPTRTFHGTGPMPSAPQVLWRFPDSAMCGNSSVGGEVINWCGTGWTGQPSVFERDGRTWVAFGAYDKRVHVIDGDTGERILGDALLGDIIKGSVTIDPDGYPLLYSGSRDNFFHVYATDRADLTELWTLSADAAPKTKWNNDWDGSALIIDDYLFEGGENSVFHIVKLNRGYDTDGLVTVDPELVFTAPGWDDELTAAVGGNVSIENSVAISGNTVYFANSGGLIQGWDITGLADGVEPTRVFRFWAGDDIDASLVIDEEGYIYAGVEYERGNQRSRDLGQVLKLDPSKPDDPLVWGADARTHLDSGVWGTLAVHRDIVIVPTDDGRILGLDRATGTERWALHLQGPVWQSPVVVDDVLVQGDCGGVLRGFDVSDTTIEPTELWSVELGGCIESTPAVWKGRIWVGTRAGFFYAVG
ncbi:MAG: PQQ-binding-like beta-propeller repeat protein [Actinomycetia bacterium]|nr:PQQ-binding-like beta-propeller repeat protein [Actinomycetes bacterium]